MSKSFAEDSEQIQISWATHIQFPKTKGYEGEMKFVLTALLSLASLTVNISLGKTIYVDSSQEGMDGIVTTLGPRETLYDSGDMGWIYFPDGPLAVLEPTAEYPFRTIFTVGNFSVLAEGTNLDQITRSSTVLVKGGPGSFDNGYAGIRGVYYHTDGNLYGYYHAEDHEGLPTIPGTGGVPVFYGSIAVVRSQDNGYHWQKMGQILTSPLPKDISNPQCQGVGEISIVRDRQKPYLYAYYTDRSMIDSRGLAICIARADVSDPAKPPVAGYWKKYFNGDFTEQGLAGLDTPIISFRHRNADAGIPHVTYSEYLGQYVMVFNVYSHAEYLNLGHPEIGGIYISYSKDCIHWSEPEQLVRIFCNILFDVEIGVHPCIIWDDETGQRGRLVYGYSERWGHVLPQKPHYMVGHTLSFLRENDGSEWSKAYRSLRYAVGTAMPGDELWVAEGVYRPDTTSHSPEGNGDREESFQLKNHVSLYGGFPSGGGSWEQRNPIVHVTTLSGDLTGNDAGVLVTKDMAAEGSLVENSYHVVASQDNDSTAVLDGFTIKGGNANGEPPFHQGGGLSIRGGTPTIRNCIFTNNMSVWAGGGIFIDGCSPVFEDCGFVQNYATTSGGGMFTMAGAEPDLLRCTFRSNYSSGGGGLSNYQANPKLEQCLFVDNSASWGGGVGNYQNKPEFYTCEFIRNVAEYTGGCFSNYRTDISLVNCTFVANVAASNGGCFDNNDTVGTLHGCTFAENTAHEHGGAMVNSQSDLLITQTNYLDNVANATGGAVHNNESNMTLNNCLFSGNSSQAMGGTLFSCCQSNTEMTNCTIADNLSQSVGAGIYTANSGYTILNCIFWGNADMGGSNESAQIFRENGSVSIGYSCIQNLTGALGGRGNVDKDPRFAESGHEVDSGDYHLKSQAGRFDPVTQEWIIDDSTSPCIDAGNPMSPIGHEPFANGGTINMGTYGGTSEASKSYFGKEPCEAIIAGDINGDCAVNLLDLSIMAFHWLEGSSQTPTNGFLGT